MNWSLRDTVFTGRSFRDYDMSLVWEWKIYYTVLCFSIRCGGEGGGVMPHLALGVWRVPGAFSGVLSHHRGWGVVFTLVQADDLANDLACKFRSEGFFKNIHFLNKTTKS